jgi:hypothetical protein
VLEKPVEGIVPSKVTLIRALLAKTSSPMLVTLFGIFTLARLWQLKKVQSSMVVTLFGTVLPFFYAYSQVCFITHNSILYKELSQSLFS